MGEDPPTYQTEPESALHGVLNPEQAEWLMHTLPKAEAQMSDQEVLPDRDVSAAVRARNRVYWILNSALALACRELDYPPRQWEWPDSRPLERLAEVLPWLPTSDWHQRQLGMQLMPTNDPLYRIPT